MFIDQLLSTLTLWATCGRPSGWEGVVCLGNPETTSTEVIQSIGNFDFFAKIKFFSSFDKVKKSFEALPGVVWHHPDMTLIYREAFL